MDPQNAIGRKQGKVMCNKQSKSKNVLFGALLLLASLSRERQRQGPLQIKREARRPGLWLSEIPVAWRACAAKVLKATDLTGLGRAVGCSGYPSRTSPSAATIDAMPPAHAFPADEKLSWFRIVTHALHHRSP